MPFTRFLCPVNPSNNVGSRVRVFVGSVMGMPGSETAFGKLTSRFFDDLLEERVL